MTKRRSRSLFVVFTIILVICLIACFVNFTYPLTINGNYFSYSSFVSNLKLGQDVSDSLRIVYFAKSADSVADSDYNTLRKYTINDLKNIVQAEGFKDLTITEYGDDSIVMVVGNILNKEQKDELTELISNPTTITFAIKEGETEKVVATGKDIKAVNPNQYSTPTGVEFYVAVEFNDDVKAELTEISAKNTIIVNASNLSFSLESGAIVDGIMPLSSNPAYESISQATTTANQIRLGMLDLELIQTECETITPTYGINANILLAIAMVVVVVAAFAFLIVKYKGLGLLASYNLLFFIVIGLFLLQSIPFVHINFAGMVAMMICFIVAVDGLLLIFERAKKHYQDGTKLHVAFKLAQKECLTRTFVSNVLIVLTGFACLFMPVLALSSFGWVALVLPFVTVFANLVLMKLFINMYLALNSTNGKKCNFHKGGKNA